MRTHPEHMNVFSAIAHAIRTQPGPQRTNGQSLGPVSQLWSHRASYRKKVTELMGITHKNCATQELR